MSDAMPSAERKQELYARALRSTTRELEARIEELAVLRDLGALFERSADLERLISYALTLVFRLSKAQNASVLLLSEAEGELVLAVAGSRTDRAPAYYGFRGYPRAMFTVGEGVAGWCAAAGQPALLDRAAEDPRFAPRSDGVAVGSLACFPLVVQGRCVGVLNLSHPDAGGLDLHNAKAWAILASHLGVAVSHALLFDRVREANRRLEVQVRERTRRLEQLNRELSRARRELEAQNEVLHDRVEERTRELQAALEELQVQNLRLEEANRVKDEFLNNVNHELKTPLNAIIGYAGLLLQELGPRLDDEHRTDLQLIESNGKHLQSILENIFCLKDIEAGSLEPERQAVDLNELVSSAVRSVRPRAVEKGLDLAFEPMDVPPVTADPTLLLRILYNLLDNAVKFSDRGAIRVRTRTAQLDPENPQAEPGPGTATITAAVVEVADQGRGIRAEDMERVFQKFHQAEPPTRKTEAGSGLGLTIAKNLVELHGGRIWVRSRPGTGSTFSFFLPLES
ncbi:sensor histidine kinase [Deferrisoma camini]|uniref:sensor histidine kinase n=1 Tax=Deferrisoma camini TaxID=1035120 RepID=UPI00046CD383|nr:GAF domain-containing sensor histidine kinase [Deferrisoma camini]